MQVLVCSVRDALLRLSTGDQGIVLVFVKGFGVERGVEGVVHFLYLIGQFQAEISVVCCMEASSLHRGDDV